MAKKFVAEKAGGGSINIFCAENILSHSAEKILRGTLYGVTDFGYRKNLCLRGLCHDFSWIFLSRSAEKTMKANRSLLCFGNFPVAK